MRSAVECGTDKVAWRVSSYRIGLASCVTDNLAWRVAMVKFALEGKTVHRVVALSKSECRVCPHVM